MGFLKKNKESENANAPEAPDAAQEAIATKPETPEEKAAVKEIMDAREAAKEATEPETPRQYAVVSGGKDTYVVRDKDNLRDVRVYKKEEGCEDPKAAAEMYCRKLNSR